MKTASVMAIVLVLVAAAGVEDAAAQRRGGGRAGGGGLAGPVELSATYGSMWGGNIQLRQGKLRTATGPSLGFALDIPLHEFASLELSYTRQDGALDWDSGSLGSGTTTLTDMSVNHWHIGAVKGLVGGKVRPFVSTGLGASHYSPSDGVVTIDGEDYNLQSVTKFSLHLGVGVKAYFGQAEKIGIRASFKTIPTLYNTGASLWFGSGGASVGVGGSGIWQWEAAAGLTVRFGG